MLKIFYLLIFVQSIAACFFDFENCLRLGDMDEEDTRSEMYRLIDEFVPNYTSSKYSSMESSSVQNIPAQQEGNPVTRGAAKKAGVTPQKSRQKSRPKQKTITSDTAYKINIPDHYSGILKQIQRSDEQWLAIIGREGKILSRYDLINKKLGNNLVISCNAYVSGKEVLTNDVIVRPYIDTVVMKPKYKNEDGTITTTPKSINSQQIGEKEELQMSIYYYSAKILKKDQHGQIKKDQYGEPIPDRLEIRSAPFTITEGGVDYEGELQCEHVKIEFTNLLEFEEDGRKRIVKRAIDIRPEDIRPGIQDDETRLSIESLSLINAVSGQIYSNNSFPLIPASQARSEAYQKWCSDETISPQDPNWLATFDDVIIKGAVTKEVSFMREDGNHEYLLPVEINGNREWKSVYVHKILGKIDIREKDEGPINIDFPDAKLIPVAGSNLDASIREFFANTNPNMMNNIKSIVGKKIANFTAGNYIISYTENGKRVGLIAYLEEYFGNKVKITYFAIYDGILRPGNNVTLGEARDSFMKYVTMSNLRLLTPDAEIGIVILDNLRDLQQNLLKPQTTKTFVLNRIQRGLFDFAVTLGAQIQVKIDRDGLESTINQTSYSDRSREEIENILKDTNLASDLSKISSIVKNLIRCIFVFTSKGVRYTILGSIEVITKDGSLELQTILRANSSKKLKLEIGEQGNTEAIKEASKYCYAWLEEPVLLSRDWSTNIADLVDDLGAESVHVVTESNSVDTLINQYKTVMNADTTTQLTKDMNSKYYVLRIKIQGEVLDLVCEKSSDRVTFPENPDSTRPIGLYPISQTVESNRQDYLNKNLVLIKKAAAILKAKTAPAVQPKPAQPKPAQTDSKPKAAKPKAAPKPSKPAKSN